MTERICKVRALVHLHGLVNELSTITGDTERALRIESSINRKTSKTKGGFHHLKRDQIIRLKTLKEDAGWSDRRIATQLGISKSAVSFWVTHHYMQTRRSGRPISIPLKTFTKVLENNPRNSLPVIHHQVSTVLRHLTPSLRTLRRYCVRLGYRFRKVKVRHQLTYDQRMERVRFAQLWLAKPNHHNVWFVDESAIYIEGSSTRAWTRCGQPTPDIRSHDPNLYIRMFAGISWDGKTQLVLHRKKFNGERYAQALKQFLVPCATKFHQSTWSLYQDNDPSHVGKKAVENYRDVIPNIIQAPTWSPDFNPIELIWHVIKSAVAQEMPRSMSTLKDVILRAWDNLSQDTVRKCIEHSRSRMHWSQQVGGDYVLEGREQEALRKRGINKK